MTKIDYKKKRVLSQEEISEEQLTLAIQETNLGLQGDALATKREIIKYEQELKEAKNAYPLALEKIIDITKKLEGFKKGLEVITSLQKELGFVE